MNIPLYLYVAYRRVKNKKQESSYRKMITIIKKKQETLYKYLKNLLK